jgi:glycosyltransferase involved in cell wall biosynthesis
MISAIVLAKNEEKNIPDCIQSLSFCNEVIVIDDHSTDSTTTLAKKMKAKVITRSLTNDFSAQRNFAMSEAKNDWILFIDADERVSKSLQDEIVHVTKKHSDVNGYYIKREDHMWGKFLKHGETGNLYLLRLAKKGKGQWYGKVHEHWNATGKTES